MRIPKYSKLPERFWSRVKQNTQTGCWEYEGSGNGDGYPHIRIGGAPKRCNRLALEDFCGTPLGILQANHACDNRKCVNPQHMYAGSQIENLRDRDLRGRTFKKLSEKDVGEIRKLFTGKRGEQRVLAERFGVSQQYISALVHNKKRAK